MIIKEYFNRMVLDDHPKALVSSEGQTIGKYKTLFLYGIDCSKLFSLTLAIIWLKHFPHAVSSDLLEYLIFAQQ